MARADTTASRNTALNQNQEQRATPGRLRLPKQKEGEEARESGAADGDRLSGREEVARQGADERERDGEARSIESAPGKQSRPRSGPRPARSARRNPRRRRCRSDDAGRDRRRRRGIRRRSGRRRRSSSESFADPRRDAARSPRSRPFRGTASRLPVGRQDQLPAGEPLGVAGVALDPAQPQHRPEGVVGHPLVAFLRREEAAEVRDLAAGTSSSSSGT